MATELEGAFERNPRPVFNNVGDTIVGMIVNKKSAPDYAYGTKEQKRNAKGELVFQDLLDVIVLDGTTAKVKLSKDDPERDAVVGELATIFLSGQSKFDFYQAKNKLGALRVSDVIGLRFDKTEDTGKGNPLKVYKVALRRAKSEESGLADRAEVEHKKLNGVVIEDAPAAGPSADASDDDFFG